MNKNVHEQKLDLGMHTDVSGIYYIWSLLQNKHKPAQNKYAVWNRGTAVVYGHVLN